ncbi:MAG: ABC transporter ATP-binding protein [Clostridia bacterium]|nr:ABC transporter ATP-binding protein [Clostridia bacterium]
MKLHIKNVKKNFSSFRVLNGVDIIVEKGSFHAVLGVSGSGKSTLLKIITGLESIEGGQILLDGKDVTHVPTETRGIAYVFQSPLLFPHLTVKENIRFGMEVKKYDKKTIEERVEELLKLLRIEDLGDRMPSEISGGQQQRVSIARALATEPSLILMDEPFSGLDPALRIEMGNLIKDLQRLLDLTIVFVTHDINESLRLSNYISLLDQGEILQSGLTHEVYYKPQNRKSASIMGDGNWIKGIIKANRFSSSFGDVSAIGFPTGEAEMFLRPHQVIIGESRAAFKVKISGISRLGKETQLTVAYGEEFMKIDTFSNENYQINQEISIMFTDSNCHIVPCG